MLTICKTFHFDAAHRLLDYDGPCGNLHGHRWTLEVEVKGRINPITHMIMDFGRLKELVNSSIIKKFDHQFVNTIIENPTAENMIMYIVQELQDGLLLEDPTLSRVRLYETTDSYAEWKAI